jgi:hypothetical protein
MRGIDRDAGCMVIVRPDQYVAHVLPLDAYAQLAAFFDGFMLHVEECRAPIADESARFGRCSPRAGAMSESG